MATKTITIMDDVYRLLRAAKSEKESFSEVLRRKFQAKRDIMEFAGAWAKISNEEAESMKKKLRQISKTSTDALISRSRSWK